MSDDALHKAEAAVSAAESNTAVVQLAMAAVEVAKAAQQQPHQGCQHAPQQFDARKWLTIGGIVCVGGCVACALALAFAVAMTAVAIGATCATGCFMILRSLWTGHQKGR
ncbi:hypothetical protein H9W91_17475 [Streptomyces alfalfae]|uniref:hypothetical protein n=1 Tax=Streptomyces alfalfae TaxID=1642299 RepID=UPI001BA5B429|nr:hypothetical protein [Streptomyces alfalfae]QUI32452.1 hypothetical protein H9W91_17475 [Streptomyces alfalfae]